jgi:hypothetical protein
VGRVVVGRGLAARRRQRGGRGRLLCGEVLEQRFDGGGALGALAEVLAC